MKKNVYDTLIECTNSDPTIKGHPYGIKNGWFIYPISFDPYWKNKQCNNFEMKEN